MTSDPRTKRNPNTALRAVSKSVPEVNKRVEFTKMKNHGKNENGLTMISYPTIARFGCGHCEWRKLRICQLTGGSNKRIPSGGMCDLRKQFLRSIYSGKTLKPSVKQLERDYLNWTMSTTFMMLQKNIYKLDQDIDDMEKSLVITPDMSTESDLKEKKDEYSTLVNRALSVYSELKKSDDKGLDRELKSKVVDKMTMSLSDIHRVMRDDVYSGSDKTAEHNTVDAEFDEVKDDD